MNHATYHSSAGADEHYFSLTSRPDRTFAAEAETLLTRYADISQGCGNTLTLRLHLSDIANQAAIIRPMLRHMDACISLIGQPPASGARLALEAWHLDGGRRTEGTHGLAFAFSPYTILPTAASEPNRQGSHGQTLDAFDCLQKNLNHLGGCVERDTVRTWLYCRDIDNNYAGLVEARNAWFARHGMTPDTHFIASTGIEGQQETPSALVGMDALSILGLQREQIAYMQAPDNLSATHHYGVAFERGTRITYGDRSAFYISGTASIDPEGRIVHPGNVALQTVRTVANIRALMERQGATLDDLKQAVVYLRDTADAPIVAAELAATPFANIPHIMLKAPVCRPGWLVEIEAIGISAQGDPRFSPLA